MFMSCTTGGRESSAGSAGGVEVDLRHPAATTNGRMIRQAMIQRFARWNVRSIDFSDMKVSKTKMENYRSQTIPPSRGIKSAVTARPTRTVLLILACKKLRVGSRNGGKTLPFINIIHVGPIMNSNFSLTCPQQTKAGPVLN